MKKNNQINTVEAKNRFNEVVAQACLSHNPVIVEKRGKPIAVIMDYESYKKQNDSKLEEESTGLIQELRIFHKMMKKEYPDGTGDSVELLKQARLERLQR